MKRVGHAPVRIMAGFFIAAMYAMPQAYTISARPGAINYTEGTVLLNGKRVANDKTKPFLMANDVLSTEDQSRAEVLLTPGVFLRVGQNSQVRMVSPSLVDTQVAVAKGEAMVEVAELGKDNNIQIKDGAASVRLEKVGLYRFTASDEPAVQVLDGKAQVEENGRHIDLGKGHETSLEDNLKSAKFDSKHDQDELLAWSKTRDEYVSAASYASAKGLPVNTYSNGFYQGFGGYYTPGWFWNSGWNSWAWLPGDGAFFSPFGFGYYSPAVVGYAPVVWTAVGSRPAPVPVNPTVASALVAGNNSVQPGWHPGKWSGTVGNQPVGNASGHVSTANIAAARSNVARAMSSGNVGGGSFGGSGRSGGFLGGGASAHVGGMSAGAGGAHAGGGGHR